VCLYLYRGVGRAQKGGPMSGKSRRRKRATLAAGAAVCSVAAAAILAAPTTADDPTKTCPRNSICEWEDGGYQTPVRWWVSTDKDLDYRDNHYFSPPPPPFQVGLNDSISAVWNNSSRWVKFFRNPNASGANLCVAPGVKVRDLGLIHIAADPNPEVDWSNRISGHFTEGYSGSSPPPDCNQVISS
jgi:hypothetical protein